VELGRLTLGNNWLPADQVEVWHFTGFPGNLGGGTYQRTAWLVRDGLGGEPRIVNGSGDSGTFATIGAALADWVAAGRPSSVIRIGDNRTYAENFNINIAGAAGQFLAIEAEDGFRPHLAPTIPITIQGANPDFSLTLGGLLIEGRVDITGSLGRLRLLHTTLVPGGSIAEPDPDEPPPLAVPLQPSIRAAGIFDGAPANTELRVEMAFSITGQVRVPDHAEGIFILDSVVDGRGTAAIRGLGAATNPGPALRLERSTLRGEVHARQIDLASEVIFDGIAVVQRTQAGCIRFSYVTPGSTTPRRYRCQPHLAERREIARIEELNGALTEAERDAIRARVRLRVRPEYTSEDYGEPAYLQLALLGPEEIATGAEDGSEMGVWCHLKQPQREANLRLRLLEYLPFGLDPGIIYVT
jgi:hypothetical protein